MEACHDIFHCRHLLKQADVLVGPGDSHVHYLVWCAAADGSALKEDIAFGHLVYAGNDIEYRCLSCAVGANQGTDLVFFYLKVNLGNSCQAAELFCNSL